MKIKTTVTFNDRSKDVPYPPDFRSDSIGFGFKDLKGKPELVSTIHETMQMQGMQKALRELCQKETPFFSIGCEKRFGDHGPGKFWGRGFIEYAYNFQEAASFENYETLFNLFRKSSAADRKIIAPATIDWEIAPVRLRDHKIMIHSCSVWVTVSDRKTEEKAKAAFNNAFEAVGDFLGTIRIKDNGLNPLFPRKE